MYRVSPIPSAGLGLISTSNIPRGTRVIVESALFELRYPYTDQELATALDNLAPQQLEIFQGLHESSFELNALPLSPVHSGILPMTARTNHSCNPNCIRRSETLPNGKIQSVLVAATDILPGNELTISYLTPGTYPTYAARQQRLQHFRFRCNCPICANMAARADSDYRRIRIDSLLQPLTCSDDKALRRLNEAYDLMQEENIPGGYLPLANKAGMIAGRCSDTEEENKWKKIAKWAAVVDAAPGETGWWTSDD